MKIDSAILAGEIKLPAGVTLAGPEDDRIAWIQPPRVSADDDAAADAVEAAEGEDSEDAADVNSEDSAGAEED